MADTGSTRDRLLSEGMRLFALQGFHATSVGEIEAAVGLQPRRGALYKHFATKQALLEAAVRTHLARAADGALEIGAVDFTAIARADPDLLVSMLRGLARWFLDEMDTMKNLTLLLEHDASRLTDLTGEVKRDIVDLSYRTAASLITAATSEPLDAQALAVVLLGSLVAVRRTEWTFGSPPLDVDDERTIAAWAELAVATFDRISEPKAPHPPKAVEKPKRAPRPKSAL
jgi:AcrR family transcriptional regulator